MRLLKAGLVRGVDQLAPVVFFLISMLTSACQSHDEKLLEKAEAESLAQRSQLAKHLFSQVIENRKTPDSLRRRALEGLAEVTSTQLFDYQTSVRTYEQLISEFSREEEKIRAWRLEAGKLWMKNLQNPVRSWQVLEPLTKEEDLTAQEFQKLARVLLSLREFDQSLAFLDRAWKEANQRQDCRQVRSLQLDFVQNFFIQKKCDRVLEWAEKSLFEGCEPDRFSLSLEKAHCLEILGEIDQAKKLLSEMINQNPGNQRAHFLLRGIEIRAREKERR